MKKKNYKLLVEGWRNFINEDVSDVTGDGLFEDDNLGDDIPDIEDIVTDRAISDTEDVLASSEEERRKIEERKRYLEQFCNVMGIKCDEEAILAFARDQVTEFDN